jgi:hypothetical protein
MNESLTVNVIDFHRKQGFVAKVVDFRWVLIGRGNFGGIRQVDESSTCSSLGLISLTDPRFELPRQISAWF